MTVIVKFCVEPVQPFNVGVTVILETIGALVVFVPVNDGILPRPLAPKPVAVLSFVQLNEDPP